jgi:hypothetical protein
MDISERPQRKKADRMYLSRPLQRIGEAQFFFLIADSTKGMAWPVSMAKQSCVTPIGDK